MIQIVVVSIWSEITNDDGLLFGRELLSRLFQCTLESFIPRVMIMPASQLASLPMTACQHLMHSISKCRLAITIELAAHRLRSGLRSGSRYSQR